MKVIVDVPSMYADHHVLVVRDLLTGQEGINKVVASSAFKQVLVEYDSDVIQTDEITNVLEQAGYTQPMEVPVQEKLPEDSWRHGNFRMTRTYPADLSMSGEFRKY